MGSRLLRLSTYISFFSILNVALVQAGFKDFTEIDSYGEWIIEQKFDPEEQTIFCRASIRGYGTWFGERIRLGLNDEIVFPKETQKKHPLSKAEIKKVQMLLRKCRSGLLYLDND